MKNSDNKENSLIRVLISLIVCILCLKIFLEIIKFLSNQFSGIKKAIETIGGLEGVYSQPAINWYPNIDLYINIIFIGLLILFLRKYSHQNKNLSKNLVVTTLFIGSILFVSNLITNEYRGIDLFLYCELDPIYRGENPYLNSLNGLTAVYSPIIWKGIYSICNINFLNKVIYSNYVWFYLGFSFFFISHIRNNKITLYENILNLSIVLTFFGTSFHGIKTGNLGFIIGILIAFSVTKIQKKEKILFYNFLLAILLFIKPFYLFWFALMYFFNFIFKDRSLDILNLKILILVQIIGNFLNYIFFEKEYNFYLENLFQQNQSINKPLNDKSGFLNLNFVDFISRFVERVFEQNIISLVIVSSTIILLFIARKYFNNFHKLLILPIFLTPRFKNYDATFLLLLFNKKNIFYEYVLFCTSHSIVFVLFSFLGAGYLLEISYVLVFIIYLKIQNLQKF